MNNTVYTPEEPIAAIATALAPAALGIVRCSGKNCIELLAKAFSRPTILLNAQGNTIVYGWIVDSSSNPAKKIDEVLVSVFRSPRSFTGEDMVEISCHGGPAVVTEIFRLLTTIGFRPANPGEFTFRSFINGKSDLTQAEAVQEIISAKTNESATRAAGRLAGNLYERIDSLKADLVAVLASLEAEIEYPEDEETIADAFDDTELRSVKQDLSALCDSWTSEKLYQDGARIILCGRTNAGKSSLFNTLLKEDRAIVSDIHGTTRDWIESWLSFEGIPARLFDTAGLRQTDDVIEQHGLRRTLDLTEDADLMIYVVDSSVGLTEEDVEFLQKAKHPVVLVFNKCDIAQESIQKTKEAIQKKKIPLADSVLLSAKTGEGVETLVKSVCKTLNLASATDRNLPGLGSARQKQCAHNALESVEHGLAVATQGYTLDAVVQDIEDAIDSLGEITGSITPEDILDTVFSKFCLGK